VDLRAETVGPAGRPAVAFIHGMMSTNRQWALNVDALVARFRVVMIELWGHGGSPAPDDPAAYGSAGLVDALDRVRERAGVDSWSMVGHSYGGAVALHYAFRRPAAVRAVVWTNSRAAMSTAGPTEARQVGEAIRVGQDQRTIPQHPVFAKRFPADLHAALMADADGTDLVALSRLFSAHWELSSRDHLTELTVPVTLINGRYERLFQTDVAWIRDHAPNVRIVEVAAGHSPNIEIAEEFDRLVIDALA